MSSAITVIEGGLVSKGREHQVAKPGNQPLVQEIAFIPDLLHPIGDNANPLELETEHIYGILAAQPDAPKLIFPQVGVNGRGEGQTLAEIANLAWSQDGNLLDLLQAGIIGSVTWDYSPLALAGELVHLGYTGLKTLEKGLSLDKALELSISQTSPDLHRGLSVLLSTATLVSLLPIPANLLAKDGKASKPATTEQPSNHTQLTPPENGGGWWELSLAGISLFLSACAQRLGLTETPPKVSVVTNTPDTRLTPILTPTEKPLATHTPTFTPPTQIPTETPFYGSGGSILPDGSPIQAQALLDLGMQLPSADCITAPNNGGNQDEWDSRIKTLAEQGASAFAIADLQSRINAKLESQQLNASTSLELCVGEGWGLAVRDNSSKLLWWPFDLEESKFADRPDRWLGEGNWEFRQMPKTGLKDGLKVEISLINGWPLALAVDKDNQPIQYFDPVLWKFINFYPDTPTPAPTKVKPTVIPATATLEPSPSVAPTPVLPCDQRGGPNNECLTHVCYISNYTDTKGNIVPKGVNAWYVDWYARIVLASGAAVVGDCP